MAATWTRVSNPDGTVTFTGTFDGATAVQMDQAFQAAYGYSEIVGDPAHPGLTIPNPVTPGEFAMTIVSAFIQEICVSQAMKQAQAQAVAQVQAKAAALATQIGV